MGTKCCICGKRLSGWTIDYPLSSQMSGFRMCGECNFHCTQLSATSNSDDIKTEIKYIKGVLEANSEADEVVKNYCNNIFESYLKGFEENKSVSEVSDEIDEKDFKLLNDMLITTGYDFQGYKITQYFDYVAAETVIGLGAFKSLLAGISNFMGTVSPELSSKIENARKLAINTLKQKAAGQYGANAIIGMDIDFTMFGDSMIAVIANGTAVHIERE